MSLPKEATTSHVGCVIEPLDASACDCYLAWLLGEPDSERPDGALGFAWSLAHCEDGVTWGHYDQAGELWLLGNLVVPEVSPLIRRDTLQELRLFGELAEVLIWRTEERLHGRALREQESSPFRPLDEPRILRGDHVRATCEHGFTHIADRTGAEQVVPAPVTTPDLQERRARLHVRHYFEQDPECGGVRISVTRLVNLTIQEGRP